MIKLKISRNDTERLFNTVSNKRFKTGITNNWVVDEDDFVRAQSILWLFCWAYNGDGSQKAMQQTRQIFDEIFPFSYNFFDARVGYEYAREKRYSNINIEEELQEMLAEYKENEVMRRERKEGIAISDKEIKKRPRYQNELKTLDIDEMEEAIASAISKLTEREYTCEIKKINYSSLSGASLTLKLNRKINFIEK